MTVICELIGVPGLDRDTFRLLSNAIVAPVSHEKEDAAVHAMGAYLDELIEDKRCAPGDDLLSALIQARDEGVTGCRPTNWSAWPFCSWWRATRRR